MIIKIRTPRGEVLLVYVDEDGCYVECRVPPGTGDAGVDKEWANLDSQPGGQYWIVDGEPADDLIIEKGCVVTLQST